MNVNELLPIRSVVSIKEGESKLMICGVLQSDRGGRGKYFDYLGVLYPEGYINKNYQYLFNQEDIEEVVFRGYEDEERASFLEDLKKNFPEDKVEKSLRKKIGKFFGR